MKWKNNFPKENIFFETENGILYNAEALETMSKFPEEIIDAIITDPPYVKMINEKWDNLSYQDANTFFNYVIKYSNDLLRFGGRLILFGSNSTQQFVYRNLNFPLVHRELITIDKGIKVVAGRNTKNYRMHPNCVEFINVNTKFSGEYTRNLLLRENENYGYTSKEINEMMGFAANGGGMWSIFTGNNIQLKSPSKTQWKKLRNIFPNLPSYTKFMETFNITTGIYNIFKEYKFPKGDNRYHPTQKPLALMEYLIKTYSNEGDLILDFTSGSGTTLLAAEKLNRRWIGIELEEKYCDITVQRFTKNRKE